MASLARPTWARWHSPAPVPARAPPRSARNIRGLVVPAVVLRASESGFLPIADPGRNVRVRCLRIPSRRCSRLRATAAPSRSHRPRRWAGGLAPRPGCSRSSQSSAPSPKALCDPRSAFPFCAMKPRPRPGCSTTCSTPPGPSRLQGQPQTNCGHGGSPSNSPPSGDSESLSVRRSGRSCSTTRASHGADGGSEWMKQGIAPGVGVFHLGSEQRHGAAFIAPGGISSSDHPSGTPNRERFLALEAGHRAATP